MHDAWYLDRMEFLSMPTDSFDECSSGSAKLIFSSVSNCLLSLLGEFDCLILLGLLVGLILSCRLI
jgi:hypothetical protein